MTVEKGKASASGKELPLELRASRVRGWWHTTFSLYPPVLDHLAEATGSCVPACHGHHIPAHGSVQQRLDVPLCRSRTVRSRKRTAAGIGTPINPARS